MKTHQLFLFNEFQANENSELISGTKFQVTNYNNPSDKFTVVVAENEDPERAALHKLGYFVVPQAA